MLASAQHFGTTSNEKNNSAHLQSCLLDRELAEDSSTIVRAHCLQLLLVEGEELSSSEDTKTADGPETW